MLKGALERKKKSRYRGCLLGGAVGDALGYPVEFMKENEIFRKYGEKGIQLLSQAGNPAVISDDTQMTLFAANALIGSASTHCDWRETLLRAYQEWLGTQGDVCCIRDDPRPRMWLYEVEEPSRLPGTGEYLSGLPPPDSWKMGAVSGRQQQQGLRDCDAGRSLWIERKL